MKVQEILQKTTQFFKQKGISSARLDSELLISRALGWNRVDIYLKTDYPVSTAELDRCRDLVRRRANGEPVAYIFGEKEFYGRVFEVTPAVLIPRPETEHLVDEGLAFYKSQPSTPFRIVDMGTGSGCIGLTFLCEIPESILLTVDISEGAIDVAKRNAARLEVEGRCTFLHQPAENLSRNQVQEALGGFADLVTGNPPYIDRADTNVDRYVKQYEPELALFSEEAGLRHVREWSQQACALLRPGGALLFEIGATQGPAVTQLFKSLDRFQDVRIIKDYSGHDRIARAVLRNEGMSHG